MYIKKEGIINTPEIPLMNRSTTDEMDVFFKDEFLPTGPELQKCNLFGSNDNNTSCTNEENEYSSPTLMYEDDNWHDHFQQLFLNGKDDDDNDNNNDINNNDDYLRTEIKIEKTEENLTPYYNNNNSNNQKQEITTTNCTEFTNDSFNLPQANIVPTTQAFLYNEELSSINNNQQQSQNETIAVQEFTSVILDTLTPDLKYRFVDKLAEEMGRQFIAKFYPGDTTMSAEDATQRFNEALHRIKTFVDNNNNKNNNDNNINNNTTIDHNTNIKTNIVEDKKYYYVPCNNNNHNNNNNINNNNKNNNITNNNTSNQFKKGGNKKHLVSYPPHASAAFGACTISLHTALMHATNDRETMHMRQVTQEA
jgi:hypothetical protein